LFWRKLHKNDYHPDVDGIKSRILLTRQDSSYKLFERWSRQLGVSLVLKDKEVLEIGHGGAWYLAEALDQGASLVTGYEIADEINSRASKALSELGVNDFELYKGNGKNLDILPNKKYDFIFSITVLQHIPTRVTKRYLRDIAGLLAVDGTCVLQVLQSTGKSHKRLSKADLFSVAYSKQEFDSIISKSGLRLEKYAVENYGSQDTYWGIYLLSKEKS
jgi:protein-L-isoaspartate O-methyltransferase